MSSLQPKATRDGFGEGLLELGAKHPDVVVLSGDLGDSTRAKWFQEKFPDRFFEFGIAEQNMIGAAAGLALSGKRPFACSFSVFITGRAWEQVRVCVCYMKANVKLVGSHAGLSVGADGATAEALEDIATMRALPGMTVIVPADARQARQATLALVEHVGPAYLRVGRNPVPFVEGTDRPFAIGRADRLRQGDDVTIVATGVMVAHALAAADVLAAEGVPADVINLHTVKPLDHQTLLASARRTGAVVTAEEHSVVGGVGSAVAEALASVHPVPMRMIGVPDRFGESGQPDELMAAFGLGSRQIADAARALASAKRPSRARKTLPNTV